MVPALRAADPQLETLAREELFARRSLEVELSKVGPVLDALLLRIADALARAGGLPSLLTGAAPLDPPDDGACTSPGR